MLGLGLFIGASKGAVLDQARLRHVLDLCSYVFTYWGFFLVVSGGCYVLGLFSCSSGVPKVPFWTRRMNCFLLWLRSDLGGVRLFRVLGSDLGGVLLFRIHCQEAANDHFLPRLSSDLSVVFCCFASIAKRLPFCVCPG